MTRRVLPFLGMLALGFILVARADEPATKGGSGAPVVAADVSKRAIEQQEILANQYKEFEQALLRLAQHLERSPKPEDRERAANLKKAIALAGDENVKGKFEKLINALQNSKEFNLPQVKVALDENQALSKDLAAILKLLMTDNRDEEIKREKKRLEDLLKELDDIIRRQKLVRAQTEGGRVEKDRLGNSQGKVTKDTEGLAKAMSKDDQGNDAKSQEDAKGDKKGDGKEDGAKGEKKGDGKGQEGSKGDAKKDGKGQDVAKGEKKGDGKGESKGGADPKKGDPTKGDPKKGGDSKGQDVAKGDTKGGDSKSGDGSKGDPKKGGDSKGGDGQKSSGKGQGQDQGGSKGGDKKQPPSNEDNPQPAAENTPGRKQIQDANEYQKQAEKDIAQEKNQEASAKQDKAVDELEKARKKLEEILRQLREEELERLLAALQSRCERMLQMQIEVYEGTVRVDKAIHDNADRKPTRVNEQKSLQLSDQEEKIVSEANKAIALLQAEGSAVAFPEVFYQVRDDMKHVARRLGKVDPGTVTQVIEQDIITTLKDMVEALKKARQEMDAKKGQPQPPGPPQNQKLIDILAELKMIRSMQIRVNSRTETYARQYVDKEGEQTKDPDIQKELNDLAKRQQKIFEVTDKLYRGLNK